MDVVDVLPLAVLLGWLPPESHDVQIDFSAQLISDSLGRSLNYLKHLIANGPGVSERRPHRAVNVITESREALMNVVGEFRL